MTAARPASPSWDSADPAQEFDLLVQDPPPPAYIPLEPHGATAYDDYDEYDDATDVDDGPWQAAEYESETGMPGRGVVLTTLAWLAAAGWLDIALTGGVTIFFDLWFVVACLVAAMAVRRGDLFTVGVLPPLAFAAVIGAVAVVSPELFTSIGGLGKAFFSGLAQHAGALVAGYAIALVTVGGRAGGSPTA